MTEFYPHLKHAHVALVLLSGSLFLVRGAFVQMGSEWPMRASLRYSSYIIDTLLVAAAIALVWILPAAMFHNGWLTVKLVLLIAYIVLGSVGLKRGRSRRQRAIGYAGAILLFAAMYAVARTHDPLGPIVILRSWMAG